MASATKSKKKKASKQKREELQRKIEEFESKRQTDAAAQGLTSPNAVPEQRPQAFAESRPDLESDRRKAQEARGDLEPMPMSAHVRAASSAQLEKAEEEEQHLGPETLREGARVKIIDGDYEGAEGAIIEVNYDGFEEAQKAKSGDPSVARFARAASYMVRTRGEANDLVEVKPHQIETVARLKGPSTEGP